MKRLLKPRSSRASSPSSLKSAPMEESDSEAEAEATQHVTADDVEEKYPIEGLYVSVAEKHEISRMREVERETILAERREENQRFKQNRMLRQLVTAAEEKEKEQQRRKRTADDADLDDQRSSRQRTRLDGTKIGETSSGLDTLRRARAEKSDRQRRREEGRDRQQEDITPRKDRRRESYDDYEDERDRDDRRRSPEDVRAVEPRLVDFERLRISRNNFAEVCFKPDFEKTLTDCYVRVLGKPQGGRQCYHMVCIKGSSPRSYLLMSFYWVSNWNRVRRGQSLRYARCWWSEAVHNRPAHPRRYRVEDGAIPLPCHVQWEVHRGSSML